MKKEILIILTLLDSIMISCTHDFVNLSTGKYDDILKNEQILSNEIEIAQNKFDKVIGMCMYNVVDDTSLEERYGDILLRYSVNMGNLEKYFSRHENIPDTISVLYSKCIFNIGVFFQKYRVDQSGNLFEINIICCDGFTEEKILQLFDHYFLTIKDSRIKSNNWHEEIIKEYNRITKKIRTREEG